MARSKKKTWLNDKKQQKKLSEAVEGVCTPDKNIYTVQFSKKEEAEHKKKWEQARNNPEQVLSDELTTFFSELEALRKKHGIDVLVVGAAYEAERASSAGKGLLQFCTLHGKNGHIGALIRELKKRNTEAVLDKIVSDYKAGEIDAFHLNITANKNQMITFKLGEPSAIEEYGDRKLVCDE